MDLLFHLSFSSNIPFSGTPLRLWANDKRVVLQRRPETLNCRGPSTDVEYLIRYGEVGLKSSRVRNRFIRKLVSNMESLLLDEGLNGLFNVERGRIYLEGNDSPKLKGVLQRVFGVVSFSPVEKKVSSNMEEICGAVLEVVEKKSFESFAMRVRRSGQHPFSSMDVAVRTGSLVAEKTGANVDLDDPEFEIFCEIRNPFTRIFTEKIDGPGGLPLGTQGTVGAVVESKEDVLAPWMMMKRGCYINVFTPDEKLVLPLKRWDPGIKIFTMDNFDAPSIVRSLKETHAKALVLPSRDFPTKRYDDFPVFAPLVALDEKTYGDLKEKILGNPN